MLFTYNEMVTLHTLEKPIPFSLAADTGALSIPRYETTFLPNMSLQAFEALVPRFYSVVKHPLDAGTDLSYSIKPEKLADGTWFYVHLRFSNGVLKSLGFGWGKLRDGFYELTVPEF